LREDLGNPETAADLHELAAAHDDFAPGGQRREGEKHRRGVVVHDERVFGSGERRQEVDGVHAAVATLSALQIVFQGRVAGAHLRDGFERAPRERRPPEVCVQDDAGRVQHRVERAGGGVVEVALDGFVGHDGWFFREQRAPRLADRGARGIDHGGTPVPRGQFFHGGLRNERIDAGKLSQRRTVVAARARCSLPFHAAPRRQTIWPGRPCASRPTIAAQPT
jgi:hypothetical protein